MSAKHTPGPWIIKLGNDTEFLKRIGTGIPFHIESRGEDFGVVAVGTVAARKFEEDGQFFFSNDIARANAALIAAAPLLKDMLQVAVNYFDKHGIDGQDLHVHEMRAALEAANGNS